MKTTTYLSILSLMTIGVFYSAAPARAQSILGLAENFVVLGATSVINTGATTLLGDLGVSPGFSITGMGSIPPTETLHQSDTAAQKAQVDANTAYDMLAGKPHTTDLTGQDLGGRTLTPGVYFFSSSAQLTGTLTLDTLNNPNALFVFQIGGSLTTASNSAVKMSNGAANDSVFWQVGSSATLGSSTLFLGNILADQNITLNTTTKILGGRAIALNGKVSMHANTISNGNVSLIPLPVIFTAAAGVVS